MGKDLDRLLKGRYFRALGTRWQRKLGAPKPDESFDELFNRARVVERWEQQYKEAEGERNEKEKEKVTAPEKQDKTAPKAKESSVNKTSDSGVSHERGGIVKNVMFSVIIVTGLDTLQSIIGRNSKRM